MAKNPNESEKKRPSEEGRWIRNDQDKDKPDQKPKDDFGRPTQRLKDDDD